MLHYVDNSGLLRCNYILPCVMVKVFTKDLGPIIMPCWTRRLATGEIAIRLWVGYWWVDFGCDAPIGRDEIERLSEPLEYGCDERPPACVWLWSECMGRPVDED